MGATPNTGDEPPALRITTSTIEHSGLPQATARRNVEQCLVQKWTIQHTRGWIFRQGDGIHLGFINVARHV